MMTRRKKIKLVIDTLIGRQNVYHHLIVLSLIVSLYRLLLRGVACLKTMTTFQYLINDIYVFIFNTRQSYFHNKSTEIKCILYS